MAEAEVADLRAGWDKALDRSKAWIKPDTVKEPA
jgi:hypothetical protein